MFMRKNRQKNGAPQPETIASADGASQRKARQLAPNGPVDQSPLDYRFNPDMSNCAAINDAHYEGGISGAGPYSKSYEDHIPYVGDRPEGAETLKGR
jgi:hypothetical protein